jgi:hypothetical protein
MEVVKKRRKGNPVPGGYKYGDLALQVGGREWLCWRGPAVIVNDTPILSSVKILRKGYNLKCSVNKNIGRGYQGACRQDELIGGKSSV